jgi:catechol 2,3-dioxygenase-like lactoylglutathione lyase family enzyme
MFDHVGVNVANLEASKEFYQKALSGLEFSVITEWAGIAAGFGKSTPIFWIAQSNEDGSHPRSTGVHICFNTEDRAVVDTFYKDALAAGGKDNGAPGIRSQYHENYYGAFVYDLDGNNIEVVCHKAI